MVDCSIPFENRNATLARGLIKVVELLASMHAIYTEREK
jgi:hypothetical protein